MKKNKGSVKILLTFLCLVFLTGLFPPLTYAQYRNGEVILFEEFNQSDHPGWTIQSGSWDHNTFYVSNREISNIVTKDTGANRYGRIKASPTWDNYRLEVDIANSGPVDEGIGFRYQDDRNYYELILHHAARKDHLNWPPEVALYRTQDGARELVASDTQLSLEIGAPVNVKIEALNEKIVVWLNSKEFFYISDTNSKVKSGTIFLSYQRKKSSYGGIQANFDNVRMTAITALSDKTPVIFIPGIGGSELKAQSDINWSASNGHGGNYQHQYPKDEIVWVNQNEAMKPGNDDYFDVLRLRSDGDTPEADLGLTGNLAAQGYADIGNYFTGLGYTRGRNYFEFAYDWRKDLKHTRDSLDNLISEAKQKSGKNKVDLVTHSMGGLVARYYIKDNEKANNIDKFIELGVPHLGSVLSLQTALYGTWLAKDFYLFKSGIPPTEIKDLSTSFTSIYQLLPSANYYEMYNNTDNSLPYPFFDYRDIDNNGQIGALDFDQTYTLAKNLNLNTSSLNKAKDFHQAIQPGSTYVDTYIIVGSGYPTLGQIKETWRVTWPFNLFPTTEEIFINGDDTVPLYSASLTAPHLDLAETSNIYYVKQKHSDLQNRFGEAMRAVTAILANAIPTNFSRTPYSFSGIQVSVHNAQLDLYADGNHSGLEGDTVKTDIPGTYFDVINQSQTAFIMDESPIVTLKVSQPLPQNTTLPQGGVIPVENSFDVIIRDYQDDEVTKTITYKDISLDTGESLQLEVNPKSTELPKLDYPALETSVPDTIAPITTVSLEGQQDSSGNYKNSLRVTLRAQDNASGVAQIRYSINNGGANQYTQPFSIDSAGRTTVHFSAIDNAGNEEIPHSLDVNITKDSQNQTTTSTPNSDNQATSATNPLQNIIDIVKDVTANNLSNKTPEPTEDQPAEVMGVQNTLGEKSSNPQKQTLTKTSFGGKVLVVIIGFVALLIALSLIFLKPTIKQIK